jgi:hypothetical protein
MFVQEVFFERFFLPIQNTSNNGRVRGGHNQQSGAYDHGIRHFQACLNDPAYFNLFSCHSC